MENVANRYADSPASVSHMHVALQYTNLNMNLFSFVARQADNERVVAAFDNRDDHPGSIGYISLSAALSKLRHPS